MGSREGADERQVEDFILWLYKTHPDSVVVSGGARGVDRCGEALWSGLGGAVHSYRPYLVRGGGLKDEVWGIEVWKLGPDAEIVKLVDHPTWADLVSAFNYRNILISAACDRLVAFHKPGRSRGTSRTYWLAQQLDKPVYEMIAGE